MSISTLLNLHSDRLRALPVAVLYITEKCGSRCICCDYWRSGQKEMAHEMVGRLARELPLFGTRYVLLSGGEPLQHPSWPAVAMMLREKGLRVAMATSGILLPRHVDAVAACIDEIFVSLDGATPESYRSIRGIDGFDLVRQGIGALAGKVPITIRTTVQRLNYREIPALIRLSKSLGSSHHSFLAVDVSSPTAFARVGKFDPSMALGLDDLDPFARVLEETGREFRTDFERGYLLESPTKLRMLHGYFAALLGLQPFARVRCNAPRFSAVIETDGSIRPCFFLPSSGTCADAPISSALNTSVAKILRQEQRLGKRQECSRCVCPSYKGARELLEGP